MSIFEFNLTKNKFEIIKNLLFGGIEKKEIDNENVIVIFKISGVFFKIGTVRTVIMNINNSDRYVLPPLQRSVQFILENEFETSIYLYNSINSLCNSFEKMPNFDNGLKLVLSKIDNTFSLIEGGNIDTVKFHTIESPDLTLLPNINDGMFFKMHLDQNSIKSLLSSIKNYSKESSIKHKFTSSLGFNGKRDIGLMGYNLTSSSNSQKVTLINLSNIVTGLEKPISVSIGTKTVFLSYLFSCVKGAMKPTEGSCVLKKENYGLIDFSFMDKNKTEIVIRCPISNFEKHGDPENLS